MSLAYLSFVIKHSRVVMLLELRRGEGAYVVLYIESLQFASDIVSMC